MAADVILTVDLGFGDAGKGSIIDWLARTRNASLVVRYNGGCQAAHNVVTPDGRHHTFAQFGSAAFVPGVHTYLSRFMLVAPDNFLQEERALIGAGVPAPAARVHVSRLAPITTPFHRAANRLRELVRGGGRHGSCGQGIGETAADVAQYGAAMLYAGDLADPRLVRRKLRFLRAAKRLELEEQYDPRRRVTHDEIFAQEWRRFEAEPAIDAIVAAYAAFAARVQLVDESFLAEQLAGNGTVLFEGAQGVLLDEDYAFFPYATRSKTTLANAEHLLAEAGFGGSAFRLGIQRAYAVRHGPGPFVTEDADLTRRLPDRHNGMNAWQREFRVGWFDPLAVRYAIAATGGVDGLAVTCLDRLQDVSDLRVATAYRYAGDKADADLARCFKRTADGSIADLAVAARPDLDRQRDLTNLLFACVPIYECMGGATHSREALAEFLADTVGAALTAVSYGMTADRKQMMPASRRQFHRIAHRRAPRATDASSVVHLRWERVRFRPQDDRSLFQLFHAAGFHASIAETNAKRPIAKS
jgi:adenylosuccinate synthase